MKKIILLLFIHSIAHADTDWQFKHDVQLKNVYNDKNFEGGEDTGSWSQGIIYRGDLSAKLNDIQVNLLPSFQYAHRLGNSHNSSDGTYAFDPITKSQPEQYHKEGLALKLGYEAHSIQYGEQWLNLPLMGLDGTKQLLPTYQGLVYSYIPNKKSELNLGHINRYNPKDEGDFKKLRVGNQESDGLSYLNFSHKFNDRYDIYIYNGYLDDLFNQFYIGVANTNKLNDKFQNKLTYKYFNTYAIGEEKMGDIDVKYYGLMSDFIFNDLSISVGFQKIDGNQNFPMIMGIPARYFINWTQGMFNKQDEESYHFNFKYNLNQFVPGLDFTYRYIYGDEFITNNQQNKETEQDYILNYSVNKGKFKGLGIQFLYIDYDTDVGRNYDELRITTKYHFKF